MKKYWHLYKLWMTRHLIYPARIVIWIIIDIIHFVVFPFIWLKIYSHQTTIDSFSRQDILTYYIVVAAISIMAGAHVAEHVRNDIIKGDLNRMLVRPLTMLWYRAIEETSFRSISTVGALLMAAIAFYLFPNHIFRPSSLISVFLFFLAVFLSFIISLSMQLIVGLTSFWLGEIKALQQARDVIEIALSGQIAPLIFFPLFLQNIANWLPFKYLYYFPTQIYLEKLSYEEIAINFGWSILWCGLLIGFTYLLWWRGVRRYDGASI